MKDHAGCWAVGTVVEAEATLWSLLPWFRKGSGLGHLGVSGEDAGGGTGQVSESLLSSCIWVGAKGTF